MRRTWWIAVAVIACMVGGVVGSGIAAPKTKFRVVNGLSNYDIHYVKVSLSTNDSWEDDRLDDDQILSPGESETWNINPGEWDLRCIDEDSDTYTRMRVCIPRGMTVEWRVTLDDLDED